MKILMTSETYLPLQGGGEMHVFFLRNKLKDMGHEIKLLTNQRGENTGDTERIQWKKSNLIQILRALWRDTGEADIVHSHYSYRLAALAGVVARIRGVPFVVTLHGLGTLNEAGASFIYRQAHALYRQVSLRTANIIISTSMDLAQVAWRYVPSSKNKTQIIFNGIDTTRFCEREVSDTLPKKYEGRKIILTVRRLVPKNGIHFLVEAMPMIVSKNPSVRYVMLGTGRMGEYIKKRIEELNLGEWIEMVGDVQNEDVPKYLAMADVVVFPSTAESTSIACAEAMSMGRKVVANNVGGLRELIGEFSERGWLVDLTENRESDYDAPLELPEVKTQVLADGILEALEDNSGLRQKRAQEYAKKELDWGVVVERTVGVYKRALDEKNLAQEAHQSEK